MFECPDLIHAAEIWCVGCVDVWYHKECTDLYIQGQAEISGITMQCLMNAEKPGSPLTVGEEYPWETN